MTVFSGLPMGVVWCSVGVVSLLVLHPSNHL